MAGMNKNNIPKPHLLEEDCWCKPTCIFNAGKTYGRVFIHSDAEDDLKHDPGPKAIIEAIKIAVKTGSEIHISDMPHLFQKGGQN